MDEFYEGIDSMQHIYYFCVMVKLFHATQCVMLNKSTTTQFIFNLIIQ